MAAFSLFSSESMKTQIKRGPGRGPHKTVTLLGHRFGPTPVINRSGTVMEQEDVPDHGGANLDLLHGTSKTNVLFF